MPIAPKIQPYNPNCQYSSLRTSSSVLTNEMGRLGSDARIADRTAGAIAAGLPAVRTVSPVLSASLSGYGANAAAGASESLGSIPNSRASDPTPMTVSQLRELSGIQRRNRRPIGFSFGHTRFAIVSL